MIFRPEALRPRLAAGLPMLLVKLSVKGEEHKMSQCRDIGELPRGTTCCGCSAIPRVRSSLEDGLAADLGPCAFDAGRSDRSDGKVVCAGCEAFNGVAHC